jgi:hypothetical protein
MPATTHTFRVTFRGRRHPDYTEVHEVQATTATEANRKARRKYVCHPRWGMEACTRVSTERTASAEAVQ